MKTYKLLVIYPGMASSKYTVTADYFAIENGAYLFYVKNGGSDPTFVASYPAGLTIIESVVINK